MGRLLPHCPGSSCYVPVEGQILLAWIHPSRNGLALGSGMVALSTATVQHPQQEEGEHQYLSCLLLQ